MTTGIPMTTKATILTDDAIAAVQAIYDNPPSHDPGVCLDMAIRAIEGLPHITPHGIGVKGLPWVKATKATHHVAHSIVGTYVAIDTEWWLRQEAGRETAFFNTHEEAKAAAQADYEARILSALQRNPEGDVEPVAWECYRPGAGSENSTTTLTRWKRDADAARASGAEVRALGYLHPPRGQGTCEPTGFVWISELYDAFNAIRDQKSHPYFDQLLAAWRALNKAATYDAALSPKATKGEPSP